jgi:hypothetical protein
VNNTTATTSQVDTSKAGKSATTSSQAGTTSKASKSAEPPAVNTTAVTNVTATTTVTAKAGKTKTAKTMAFATVESSVGTTTAGGGVVNLFESKSIEIVGFQVP